MLYRIVRLGRCADAHAAMNALLAAIRPVVTSQLPGAWLHGARSIVYRGRSLRGGRKLLTPLPPQLFVDPELRDDPTGWCGGAAA